MLRVMSKSSSVTATQNRLFDVLQPQIGHVVHPQTSLTTTLRKTTGKSIHGSETPFSLDNNGRKCCIRR